MFRAYFDGSGKEELGIIAVGGWVATTEKWAVYQERWNAVLADHGIAYFRMSKFAQNWGPFKEGWRDDEPRRRRLIVDLAAIIKDTVEYGVVCAVRFDDFKVVDQEYELSERYGNAYAFAASDCIGRINNRFLLEQPNVKPRDVSYVLDDGDDGKGHLIRIAEAKRISIPAFHPSRDMPDGRKGVVQLQCADFLAYEGFKLCSQYVGPPGVKVDKMRKTAQFLLDPLPRWWGIYTPDKLRSTLDSQGIARRGGMSVDI